MKKYFVIAAAALVAMCACTKNEVNQLPDEEITFQVADYVNATKAGDQKLCGNTDFHVLAYYSAGDWDQLPTTVYMSDNVLHPTTGDDAGKWTTATKYYWPKTGKLSFVGYAPSTLNTKVNDTDNVTYSYDETNKKGIITIQSFTVNEVPGTDNEIDPLTSIEAKQRNLQYAASYTDKPEAGSYDYAYSHAGGVPMLFRHILSKLYFKVAYLDNTTIDPNDVFKGVKVTNITIKNIDKTGTTYTVKEGAAGTWASTSSVITAQALNTAAVEVAQGGSAAAVSTAAANGYFVMPQDIPAYAALTAEQIAAKKTEADNTTNQIAITYQFKLGDNNYTAAVTSYVNLKTTTIASWDPAKTYTYTLQISPVTDKVIVFDPAVAAWTAGNGDGETIENIQ